MKTIVATAGTVARELERLKLPGDTPVQVIIARFSDHEVPAIDAALAVAEREYVEGDFDEWDIARDFPEGKDTLS